MLQLKIVGAVVVVLGMIWLIGLAAMRRQDQSIQVRKTYARQSTPQEKS